MQVVTYAQTLHRRLAKSKAGAVATEYAFLIAFISIVAAIGMVLLGDNLSLFFNDIGQSMENAGGNLPPLS
jgi:Flp pilus assembly pilin Flp